MNPSAIAITTMFLVLTSCTDLGTVPTVDNSLEDIREVVFRHQFSNNASAQQQGAQVYFVALRVQTDTTHQSHYIDCSDNLMDRFAGNSRPVKRFSECSMSGYGVIDKRTGAYGILFRIESITEIDPHEAEVAGGYFEGGLSASGNIYRVKWTDGWVVISDILSWIS
jgi:hypothetical protein